MPSDICMHVGSASYMTGLFLVPITAARSCADDEFFEVAEVLPGKAVFFVGSGEFRECDIGAYRELYIGFYTENRESPKKPSRITNFIELLRNQSKLHMWKNWLTTQAALDKMDRAGGEIFRPGAIERINTRKDVTFAMDHQTEGSIAYTVPRNSRTVKSNVSLQKTHYGRLHGEPSLCHLDLNIEHMAISPGRGDLQMQGDIARECQILRVPKKPLASIWIEEMSFSMHRPSKL